MVLRCSLLGHDYGDPEVEREREERGSEVVVTVQEYKECTRCGERTVISENTEVTSLSGPDANAEHPRRSDADAAPPAEQPDNPDAATVDAETDGTDAEFIDADGDPDDGDSVVIQDAESNAPDESDPAVDPDHPTDEDGEPVTDDGEILTDDEDESPRERDRGEWPDSSDVGPTARGDEPAEWDEEEPVTNDAVVLEHTDATDATGGTESVATESEIANGATVDDDPQASPSGIERAEPAPSPGETNATGNEDVPTEFYCPRCEFAEADDRGSLRAGDICPDCRKGYLSERPLR
ncbi:DUF7093 family protein [Halopiger goleimassiliensis]|uniref:DUF7093 family protein n=1 Tax=Halopiger goleimassiliensis TaxID=1293048 RepID=UPI000677A9B5|nr:hypothetical protein [Halopiger goleimassiliensis]